MWACWERGAEDGEERAAKVRNNTTLHTRTQSQPLKPNMKKWWRNAQRKWENTLQRVGQNLNLNFYNVCSERHPLSLDPRQHCDQTRKVRLIAVETSLTLQTAAWTEAFPSLIWGTTEVSISRQPNLWSVLFTFTIQLSTQSGPQRRFSDVSFGFLGFWL